MLEKESVHTNIYSRLLDTPCNLMNTMNFLDEILKVKEDLSSFGVTCTVIKGEELR